MFRTVCLVAMSVFFARTGIDCGLIVSFHTSRHGCWRCWSEHRCHSWSPFGLSTARLATCLLAPPQPLVALLTTSWVAMAPHLTPAELDWVHRQVNLGKTPMRIHSSFTSRRARRDVSTPHLTALRKTIKGFMYKRGHKETRGRKRTYSRKWVVSMNAASGRAFARARRRAGGRTGGRADGRAASVGDEGGGGRAAGQSHAQSQTQSQTSRKPVAYPVATLSHFLRFA